MSNLSPESPGEKREARQELNAMGPWTAGRASWAIKPNPAGHLCGGLVLIGPGPEREHNPGNATPLNRGPFLITCGLYCPRRRGKTKENRTRRLLYRTLTFQAVKQNILIRLHFIVVAQYKYSTITCSKRSTRRCKVYIYIRGWTGACICIEPFSTGSTVHSEPNSTLISYCSFFHVSMLIFLLFHTLMAFCTFLRTEQ